MPDSNLSMPLEGVLEHSGWLRELARRLVRDPNAADDLAQSTWLAALEHRPSTDRPLRQWLASVLRNFARQEVRRSARMRAREQSVARPEAEAPADERLMRAALQREIVDAVLTLNEPYRMAILMRFLEERSPRDIAHELGIPVETVHTRIARGVERLRAKLDANHGGDRRSWLALLWPLADRPGALTSSVLGTIVMTTQWKLVLAGLSILGAIAIWMAVQDTPVSSPVSASVAAEPPAIADPPAAKSELEVATSAVAREVAPSEPADARGVSAPAPAAKPSAELVRGKVLDARGSPASAVALAFVQDGTKLDGAPRLMSSSSGTFEIAAPEKPGRIVAADPKLTTVLAGLVGTGAGKIEPVVIVARRIPLAGRVVDEQGFALEGARVALEIGQDFRTRFREVLDRSLAGNWTAKTDASGAFAIDEAPAVDAAKLRATLDGFDAFETAAPEVGDRGMIITLARPRATDGWVRGVVLGPDSKPLSGAQVSFGIDSTKTGGDGAFAFDANDERSLNRRMDVVPKSLIAVTKGLQSARFDAPVKDGKPDWPASVTLRLVHTPLDIAGRVIGTDGEPLANARVWIADATTFGAVGDRLVHVESILVGAEGGPSWRFVNADADGKFRIDGLLDREYRVRAMDESTLLRVQVGPVRAGDQSVELRLPAEALHPRVAGRVVGNDGKPIAGVRIFPMCDPFQQRFQGEIVGTTHEALDGVVTDADGRFEITNVPKTLVYLRVDGETVIPFEYCRTREGDPSDPNAAFSALPMKTIENLTIVVDQRCHLQVELSDPEAADELAVLDREGKEVTLNTFVGNGRSESPRVSFTEGRTAAVGLADRGKTIVLYRERREVFRTSVQLVPGELQSVKL